VEREKETEKRKEEARKVRKKIADDRYAEYDVSEYGLSSIVEEEEVEVECSNLYCLATKIDEENCETKTTRPVKVDDRLEKKNKVKKQKQYIRRERRLQSIRDKLIEKERKEKESREKMIQKERKDKEKEMRAINTTRRSKAMHVHTTVTHKHKESKCSSVGKCLVHTVCSFKFMMYAMMLLLGCVVSSVGVELELGASVCGSICTNVSRRGVEAVGFGFTLSNQTFGSVVDAGRGQGNSGFCILG